MITYFIAKLNFSKQGIKIGTLQSQILQSLFTHGINENHAPPSVSVSSGGRGEWPGRETPPETRSYPGNTRDAASRWRRHNIVTHDACWPANDGIHHVNIRLNDGAWACMGPLQNLSISDVCGTRQSVHWLRHSAQAGRCYCYGRTAVAYVAYRKPWENLHYCYYYIYYTQTMCLVCCMLYCVLCEFKN